MEKNQTNVKSFNYVLDSCWIDFCLSSHEKNQNNFIGIFFQYIKPSSPDRPKLCFTIPIIRPIGSHFHAECNVFSLKLTKSVKLRPKSNTFEKLHLLTSTDESTTKQSC